MESVWAVDEEKYLTLQNRRTGVVREPGGRVGNVLDANQRHLTVGIRAWGCVALIVPLSRLGLT